MSETNVSLASLVSLASKAGDAILQLYYGRDGWVREKSDGSPVTEADMASEHVIRIGLMSLDPSIPYLSEESSVPSDHERRDWKRFWLVDPLDGTKEFLRRTDEFTVNIALIEDRAPILGVVAAPALRLLILCS